MTNAINRMGSQAPVEILRLSRERMEGGIVYLYEMSFMSDNLCFARLSRREDDTEDNWHTPGWVRQPDWKSMDRLNIVAQMKAKSGWEVSWNPAVAPGLGEFRKEVKI